MKNLVVGTESRRFLLSWLLSVMSTKFSCSWTFRRKFTVTEILFFVWSPFSYPSCNVLFPCNGFITSTRRFSVAEPRETSRNLASRDFTSAVWTQAGLKVAYRIHAPLKRLGNNLAKNSERASIGAASGETESRVLYYDADRLQIDLFVRQWAAE